MEGGIIMGAEESFDFNPPEAGMNSSPSGFDVEFNESIIPKDFEPEPVQH